MWFVWIIVGLVAFVVWMFWQSNSLCPSCGTELGDEFGNPGVVASHCTRCGWRGH